MHAEAKDLRALQLSRQHIKNITCHDHLDKYFNKIIIRGKKKMKKKKNRGTPTVTEKSILIKPGQNQDKIINAFSEAVNIEHLTYKELNEVFDMLRKAGL